jgi:hypothetical protein
MKLLTLWTVLQYHVSRRAVPLMRGNLFMICQQWAAVISSISNLFSVAVSEQCGTSMVRYTLEQRVFLYDTYVNYGSARKCR